MNGIIVIWLMTIIAFLASLGFWILVNAYEKPTKKETTLIIVILALIFISFGIYFTITYINL